MFSFSIKIFLTLFFLNIIPVLYFSFKKENIIECQENGPKCNLNNGKCISSNCQCFPGFITYPEDNPIKCNYKLRSTFVAFLLEIFSCNGFGLFYIRKYFYALIKFLGWIIMYIMYQKYAKFKEKNSLVIIIISSIIFLGMLSLQVFDVCNFFRNKYLDGNEIKLIKW